MQLAHISCQDYAGRPSHL